MDSLVPGSKIADMPTGWICGQTARDLVKTKTGRGRKTDIQESEEFQTSKFYAKTDFDMAETAKERILYSNFLRINAEVKSMIAEIQEFNKQETEAIAK